MISLFSQSWSLSRFFRSKQGGPEATRIAYTIRRGTEGQFMIVAKSAERDFEVGRVVAEKLVPMSCCYVFDLTVEPAYQRQGIARELLSQALKHSQCKHLVPVSITREACAFWAHLAGEEESAIRLGLTNHDVNLIRYANRRFASERTEPFPEPQGK
jgi:ribosomal protein S18 acetylase RimI-like enzyme